MRRSCLILLSHCSCVYSCYPQCSARDTWCSTWFFNTVWEQYPHPRRTHKHTHTHTHTYIHKLSRDSWILFCDKMQLLWNIKTEAERGSRVCLSQWRNVTKYIYSSAGSTNLQIYLLNLRISILHYFFLPIHHISEANIVLFTPLHLSDSFSLQLKALIHRMWVFFRLVFWFEVDFSELSHCKQRYHPIMITVQNEHHVCFSL